MLILAVLWCAARIVGIDIGRGLYLVRCCTLSVIDVLYDGLYCVGIVLLLYRSRVSFFNLVGACVHTPVYAS